MLKYDEISDLYEKVLATVSIVSAKFPQMEEIEEDDVEKLYLNNPQSVGMEYNSNFQSTELESRGCNSGFWNDLRYGWCVYNCSETYIPWSMSSYNSCANNCYWSYCSWSCGGFC